MIVEWYHKFSVESKTSYVSFSKKLLLVRMIQEVLNMPVFGWNYRKEQNFGPAKREKCSFCNNEVTFLLRKISTCVTLFSFPIIPYRIDYILICPICNKQHEIDSWEFYELVACIRNKNEDEDQLVSSERYITENGAIYRTETQINFIKQMKEIEMEREKRNNKSD